MRHLGNYAVVAERGVGLECAACQVSWIGCAAARECPKCGKEQDWWLAASLNTLADDVNSDRECPAHGLLCAEAFCKDRGS